MSRTAVVELCTDLLVGDSRAASLAASTVSVEKEATAGGEGEGVSADEKANKANAKLLLEYQKKKLLFEIASSTPLVSAVDTSVGPSLAAVGWSTGVFEAVTSGRWGMIQVLVLS